MRICLSRESFPRSQWADVNLQFLSFVSTDAVPLHLIAGPSFDVFTTNLDTETWLGDHLLGAPQEEDGSEQPLFRWWENTSGQSNIGILLQVNGEIEIGRYGARVTELLLYAALPRHVGQGASGILTPPRSSSPVADHGESLDGLNGSLPIVNIYALPLRSDHIFSLQAPLHPPTSSSEGSTHEYAQFLPSPTEDDPHPKGRKRLHLDSLFHDATHQAKRSKKRGGESVAKAMASLDKSHSQAREQPTLQTEATSSGTQVSSSVTLGKARLQRNGGLSRAHSLGSLRDLQQIRPTSRGSAVPSRRSTLSRMASVGAFQSSSPALDSLDGIEQQNKTALSRVVMAGMRMYGLQQKKKSDHSRAGSETPLSAGLTPTIGSIPDGEDEYKLVYHQTYKAASFAFRQHISVTAIGQETMRDMVDRILEMFCVDPLEESQRSDVPQQGFGDMEPIQYGAFDAPSASCAIEIPSVRAGPIVQPSTTCSRKQAAKRLR